MPKIMFILSTRFLIFNTNGEHFSLVERNAELLDIYKYLMKIAISMNNLVSLLYVEHIYEIASKNVWYSIFNFFCVHYEHKRIHMRVEITPNVNKNNEKTLSVCRYASHRLRFQYPFMTQNNRPRILYILI